MNNKHATEILSYVRNCQLRLRFNQGHGFHQLNSYIGVFLFLLCSNSWATKAVDGFFKQAGDQLSSFQCALGGEDPGEAQNPPHTQRTLIHLEHHPLICLHHFI